MIQTKKVSKNMMAGIAVFSISIIALSANALTSYTCASGPDACAAAASHEYDPSGAGCEYLSGSGAGNNYCLHVPDPNATCNPGAPVQLQVYNGTCQQNADGSFYCNFSGQPTTESKNVCQN